MCGVVGHGVNIAVPEVDRAFHNSMGDVGSLLIVGSVSGDQFGGGLGCLHHFNMVAIDRKYLNLLVTLTIHSRGHRPTLFHIDCLSLMPEKGCNYRNSCLLVFHFIFLLLYKAKSNILIY